MIRTLLIASAFLAASGSVFAQDGYGRVVSVEPYVSVAFGSSRHDGFRVVYESGGRHYWTHMPSYPDYVIAVPPPHRVHYIDHYTPQYKRHYKHHDKHWRDDRRDWDDRHDGWRGHREHRRHDDD